MEISEKFRRLRKALRMGQAEFAKPLGVGVKQISAIETGRVQPSASVVELVFLKHGVNRQWWASGEGPMFREPGIDDESIFSKEDLAMFKLIVDEPELHLAAKYLVKLKKEARRKALGGVLALLDEEKTS